MDKCVNGDSICAYKGKSGECLSVTIKNFHCMKKQEQNEERINKKNSYMTEKKQEIEHTNVYDIDETLVVAKDLHQAIDIFKTKYNNCEIQNINVLSFNKVCITMD